MKNPIDFLKVKRADAVGREKRKVKNPIVFLKVKRLTPWEGKNEKRKGKNPVALLIEKQ